MKHMTKTNLTHLRQCLSGGTRTVDGCTEPAATCYFVLPKNIQSGGVNLVVLFLDFANCVSFLDSLDIVNSILSHLE